MKLRLILTLPLVLWCMAGYANDRALNYCATPESWATQMVLGKLKETYPDLATTQTNTHLLVRTPLTDQGKPVTLGEWGPLYTQTILITVPFTQRQRPPVRAVASSIISAVECSLSDPDYIELSQSQQPG